MAANILHVGATIQCFHGTQVNIQTTNQKVKVSKKAVITVKDTFTVSGCPFQIPVGAGTKPQPCVTIKWVKPALRVKVNGQPVLLADSKGICQSGEQIPQGTPNVVSSQIKAKGS